MTATQNTVSVVIGGSTGIGRAVADALTARPGRVHVASRRTGLDVTNADKLASYFEKLGPIDHLVVTSGSQAPGGKVTEIPLAEAKAAFDVKFWGTIAVVRAAAVHIRSGGTITLTSGFLARRIVPGTYVKTTMNTALEAAAKILARELSPIRVNVISPGLTNTEAYAGMAENARRTMLERAAADLPAATYGRPQDLAAAYLFAIDNPFVTGSVIDVEGGALIN